MLLAERQVIGRGGRWVHAFNVVLTLALVGVLLFQLMPLEVAFVVAFALALVVNLPSWDDQQELFEQHGGNVVLVMSMIFAAGVLTGILTGTEDDHRDGRGLVSVIPDGAGGLLPLLTAITSMPLTSSSPRTRTTSASCRSWPRPTRPSVGTRGDRTRGHPRPDDHRVSR